MEVRVLGWRELEHKLTHVIDQARLHLVDHDRHGRVPAHHRDYTLLALGLLHDRRHLYEQIVNRKGTEKAMKGVD